MIIWDVAVSILAFAMTFPFMATLFVYAVNASIYHYRWRAVHAAVNWTTVLYLIVVPILLKDISGHAFAGVMIALLLTLFIIIVVIHWKVRQEIIFRNVFTIFWRVCFLLFLGLYCLLVLIGLISALINNLSSQV